MAWLYEHPRSKNWFIGWRVGKKIFNRSTGTSDRKQAEKKLATYNLLSDAHREKRLTEDFYHSLLRTEPKRTPLRAAVQSFMEARKGKAAGTVVRYRLVLESLCGYLHASDAAPVLAEVGTEPIQLFLNDVKQRTTATTANFYFKVLRAFFNHSVHADKITASPMKGVQVYKRTAEEAENNRRPFEKSEMRDAYAAAPNDFWRFAIVFGLYTGLRLGNVASLRWRNVDLEKKLATVVDIKHPDGLKIPICSPFLLNMFYTLRNKGRVKPDNYIFPDYAKVYLTKSKHGENDAATLSAEFRDILVKAGILEKYERKKQGTGRSCKRVTGPVSYHSLRHNFITTLQERGASQMIAKQLVGHDSDAVNDLYTHVSPNAIRQALKKLPEVFK